MSMRRVRTASVAVLIPICVFAAAFFGRQALSAQDRVSQEYQTFTAALRAIEDQYSGDAKSDELVYGAISGLLGTLDPHSHFSDPKSYAQDRERQEGRYYGLGIAIRQQGGDVVIGSVYEGAPAYEAGLRRGDIITAIEGELAKSWGSDKVVARLRGPRGTFVNLLVTRNGFDDPIKIRVRRDEVHIPTVSVAVMLDDSTGYIKVDQFGENTDPELGRALADLTKQGMKRLVFDLRANPGGVLPQAILVANRFLPRGSMIVYTRGRVADSAQDYRAIEPTAYLNVPMVTLVNRDSASASEIVSGALQDHDRSLIVGETTFGKALVQSVYRVSGGAGAAIPTARYYTPSGRLIQRPWDATFDEYLMYGSQDQEKDRPHKAEDLKRTDSGRAVYSGGGIQPDERFSGRYDGFNPTPFGRAILGRGLFDEFAERFARAGDTRLPAGVVGKQTQLHEGFLVSDVTIAVFKTLVKQSPLKFDDKAWQQDLPFITAEVQKEIDTDLFGVAVAYEHLAKRDPQLGFGVNQFPEAVKLLALSSTKSTTNASKAPALQ
jgi:carboxyl-terminal processing protease